METLRHIAKIAGFKRYFLANTLALAGEGMFYFSATLHIAAQTGKPSMVALLLLVTMVPATLLTPIAGLLLDRFSRTRLIQMANAGRVVTAASTGLCLYYQAPLAFFLTSMLIYYVLWYMVQTGLDSIFQDLFSEKVQTKALSVTQVGWQVGLMGSAAVAGYLIETQGVCTAFLAAALCDVGFALALPRIAGSHLPEVQAPAESPATLQEALSYLAGKPKLAWAAAAAAFIWPLYQALNTLLPQFSFNVIGLQESKIGLLDACAGMGSILAMPLAFYASSKQREGRVCLQTLAGGMAAVLLFQGARCFTSAAWGYLLIGTMLGSAKVLTRSLTYHHLDRAYAGRVMGLVTAASLLLSTLLCLGVGLIGDRSILAAFYIVAFTTVLPLGCVFMSAFLDPAT